MPLWLPWILPWIGLVLFVLLRVRLPEELPEVGPAAAPAPDGRAGADRLVSIVVPARNEAHNIRTLLDSLVRSRWSRFEIVVVDDRSTDGTGEIARSVTPGRAERLVVVRGAPLPEGWLGKPWACHQGSREAGGDLLLFTDADTIHAPDLLPRTVAALREDAADVVTVMGRQLMESFWERLVQPQIFMNMVFRYPDLSRPIPARRWRSAIANGQYLLFRREVYEAIGGHEAVYDAVVEDLRLAQILVRDGWRFRIRRAEDGLATRMYRSLRELVEGWSKNIVLGGLQTLPPALRPFTPPAMLLTGLSLWVVPPVVLGVGMLVAGAGGTVGAGVGGSAAPFLAARPSVLSWAACVVAISLGFWCAISHRFRVPWAYGLLYPVGAVVALFIVARSWLRMGRVRWKGRTYRGRLHPD